MQRLIDANAMTDELIKGIEADTDKSIQSSLAKSVCMLICKVIERQPTIDAEPHWIPCSERMPEEPFGCLVTVWDTDPVTMDEFENILPYFVGWDGEQWNDGDGLQCPFEVIAWMPLPKPYPYEGDKE